MRIRPLIALQHGATDNRAVDEEPEQNRPHKLGAGHRVWAIQAGRERPHEPVDEGVPQHAAGNLARRRAQQRDERIIVIRRVVFFCKT